MSENIWLTRLCAHGYILVDDDGMAVMGLFNIILGSGLVWFGVVKKSEHKSRAEKIHVKMKELRNFRFYLYLLLLEDILHYIVCERYQPAKQYKQKKETIRTKEEHTSIFHSFHCVCEHIQKKIWFEAKVSASGPRSEPGWSSHRILLSFNDTEHSE